MASYGNSIQEGSDTGGSGNLTLIGPTSDKFFRFWKTGVREAGTVMAARIEHTSLDEVEICDLTLIDENTVSRGTIYASSNGDARVSFSPGRLIVSHVLLASVVENLGVLTEAQAANRGLWGPVSGAAALPTFRIMVAADVPDGLINDSKITGPISTGKIATILTGKTLSGVTINDFDLANHNHLNVNGGGLLDAAAIGTGGIAPARIAAAVAGGTLPFSGTSLTGTSALINGNGTTTPTGPFRFTDTLGTSVVYMIGDAAAGAPRIYMGGSSSGVAGIFNRRTTSASFYFGEDSDTGGAFFRGTGGFTVSASNASGRVSALFKNGATNATTNYARIAVAPHSGYDATNAPFMEAVNDGNDAFLAWGTFNSGLAERMRLSKEGRLGIGTNSPAVLLDINSDVLRLRTSKTPASGSAGNEGDVCSDSSYVYVYRSGWKRAALAAY